MQLTLYMLRGDLPEGSWGLRDVAAEYEEVPTRPIGSLNFSLLIRQSDPTPPRWLRDLIGIVRGDFLSALLNRNSAALLLVRHRGYRFILAYGTGRFAIDRSAIEPGFGLRVVANSVASSRVKSADTRGLGGRTRSQRTAMASAGPLYELGIEPSEEWVRQLEGMPTIDFAHAAVGSDSLRIKIKDFALLRLEEKLDQIIERYESSDYKKEYDFLDYFTRVHREDKKTCDALRVELINMLRSQSPDLDFADPDILEPLEVDYYVLRDGRLRSPELPELTQEAVFSILDSWALADPLKVRVEAYDNAGGQVADSSSIFEYVAAEVPYDGRRFVLSAGQWFVVDESYVERVQKRIEAITDLTDELALDIWQAGEDEGDYNERIEGQRAWKLLDKDNFPIGGPNQKVEVCDLLTENRHLICVKRMNKSSTLSHLFLQGLVSAQLMVADADGYQQRVVEALSELRPGSVFGSREGWTVVYAIATDKKGPLAKSLYFFSKVSLDRISSQLRSIGVRVAVARIPLER